MLRPSGTLVEGLAGAKADCLLLLGPAIGTEVRSIDALVLNPEHKLPFLIGVEAVE